MCFFFFLIWKNRHSLGYFLMVNGTEIQPLEKGRKSPEVCRQPKIMRNYQSCKELSNCSVCKDEMNVILVWYLCIFQCHSNETLGNVRQKIANRLSKTPDHIQVVAQDKLVVSRLALSKIPDHIQVVAQDKLVVSRLALSKTPDHIQVVAQDKLVVSRLAL